MEQLPHDQEQLPQYQDQDQERFIQKQKLEKLLIGLIELVYNINTPIDNKSFIDSLSTELLDGEEFEGLLSNQYINLPVFNGYDYGKKLWFALLALQYPTKVKYFISFDPERLVSCF